MADPAPRSKFKFALLALSIQFLSACAASTHPTTAAILPSSPQYPTTAPVLPSRPLHIRDAVRMKNEVPNELIGMGLVLGLQGTGDGPDFLPTVRALTTAMQHLNTPLQSDEALKNSNNIALVALSMLIPPAGAHAGDKLDIKLSAMAAKSLKCGQLLIVPLYAPAGDRRLVLATASGTLTLPDENRPTQALIPGGGVLLEDILPEQIKDSFTFVIHPYLASYELATAIADQINEDATPQTDGKPIAIALNATSVQVTIPQAERANQTPFIARLLRLPLPKLN